MVARPLTATLLLALLALSGCAGKGDDAPSATAGANAGGAAAAHALHPPVLKVGDWWNFTAPGGDLSYVVSADAGSDYTMDTDNAGLAFFNALSDVSTLGAIRKSDLAGSQGADRVEFLKWPLTDGKNWTTTWDGLRVTVHAKVAGEEAQLTARRENGTLFAAYTYSNRTRWFTALDFMDEAGQPAFRLKLQASGANFGGRLVRYAVDEVSAGAPPPQPQVGYNGNFNVPAGATDVHLTFSTACNPGIYFLSMGPLAQDAESQGAILYGACDGAHTNVVPVAPSGGAWGISLDCTSPTSCALSYRLLVRTLTSFKAGEAPAA